MKERFPKVPRGKYAGVQVAGTPKSERDHFYQCKDCGQMVDMRDLGQVFDHERPLPHPKETGFNAEVIPIRRKAEVIPLRRK